MGPNTYVWKNSFGFFALGVVDFEGRDFQWFFRVTQPSHTP